LLAVYLPPAWVLLLPIIGVEALVGSRRFGLPIQDALRSQAWANAFSTLLGVPLAWALLASLQVAVAHLVWNPRDPNCYVQAVTQPLWLMPPLRACPWVVPVVAVSSFVFFFCLSVVSEYAVLRIVASSLSRGVVWRWAVAANLWSYLLLASAILGRSFWPHLFAWVTKPFESVVWFFSAIGLALARLMGAA
jgi:hypothetical protein